MWVGVLPLASGTPSPTGRACPRAIARTRAIHIPHNARVRAIHMYARARVLLSAPLAPY
jgi:hypothetical protein